MTTYRTKDGIEYERYEKFTIKWIATLYWIPLLVGENRVRYFESSQLVEIKSPFDSGMAYCYPEEAPLYYTVPENVYPQALWLGIANGILEQSKRKLDIRLAIAESELGAVA